MKRFLIALILAGGAWLLVGRDALVLPGDATAPPATGYASGPTSDAEGILARAFDNQQSNIQVRAHGIVQKVLPDDRSGSRHQRFLLRVGSSQTLLIAHNIDLAPRIESLREGDTVAFFGEYEWNNKGGVIHWTHRDPQGRHPDGWLEHRGRRYE